MPAGQHMCGGRSMQLSAVQAVLADLDVEARLRCSSC